MASGVSLAEELRTITEKLLPVVNDQKIRFTISVGITLVMSMISVEGIEPRGRGSLPGKRKTDATGFKCRGCVNLLLGHARHQLLVVRPDRHDLLDHPPRTKPHLAAQLHIPDPTELIFKQTPISKPSAVGSKTLINRTSKPP